MTSTQCFASLACLEAHPFTVLSLSDREKFHTGLLAFAMNRYPNLIRQVFPGTGSLQNLGAFPEERSIDLVVKSTLRDVAAAEIKLKTDLHDDQLNKINRLLPGTIAGIKAVVGLFQPVRKEDRDWMRDNEFRWLSLTEEIPQFLRPMTAAETDPDIAPLMRLWFTYLAELDVVRKYFSQRGAHEIEKREISESLCKIKLRGIFEAYRYNLVCQDIKAGELQIGNTHGNAQIHIPLELVRDSQNFGLQWQSGILKVFIEIKATADKYRLHRDAELRALATRVHEFILERGWRKDFEEKPEKLNKKGMFRSITIARWNCFDDLRDKGDKINILITYLRQNPPAASAGQ